MIFSKSPFPVWNKNSSLCAFAIKYIRQGCYTAFRPLFESSGSATDWVCPNLKSGSALVIYLFAETQSQKQLVSRGIRDSGPITLSTENLVSGKKSCAWVLAWYVYLITAPNKLGLLTQLQIDPMQLIGLSFITTSSSYSQVLILTEQFH